MNIRLKQFLAAENITQAQFADKINVVRASVSHILSGRNNPSFDFIKAMMSHYPNLNMEWLVFGKGKMYKDNSTAETEQLFPVEIPHAEPSETFSPPLESVEFSHESEIPLNSTPINESKALDNKIQHIIQQRKVTKVIVLFDDGTYQEL